MPSSQCFHKAFFRNELGCLYSSYVVSSVRIPEFLLHVMMACYCARRYVRDDILKLPPTVDKCSTEIDFHKYVINSVNIQEKGVMAHKSGADAIDYVTTADKTVQGIIVAMLEHMNALLFLHFYGDGFNGDPLLNITHGNNYENNEKDDKMETNERVLRSDYNNLYNNGGEKKNNNNNSSFLFDGEEQNVQQWIAKNKRALLPYSIVGEEDNVKPDCPKNIELLDKIEKAILKCENIYLPELVKLLGISASRELDYLSLPLLSKHTLNEQKQEILGTTTPDTCSYSSVNISLGAIKNRHPFCSQECETMTNCALNIRKVLQYRLAHIQQASYRIWAALAETAVKDEDDDGHAEIKNVFPFLGDMAKELCDVRKTNHVGNQAYGDDILCDFEIHEKSSISTFLEKSSYFTVASHWDDENNGAKLTEFLENIEQKEKNTSDSSFRSSFTSSFSTTRIITSLMRTALFESISTLKQRICLYIDPIDGTSAFIKGVTASPMILAGITLDKKAVAACVMRLFIYNLETLREPPPETGLKELDEEEFAQVNKLLDTRRRKDLLFSSQCNKMYTQAICNDTRGAKDAQVVIPLHAVSFCLTDPFSKNNGMRGHEGNSFAFAVIDGHLKNIRSILKSNIDTENEIVISNDSKERNILLRVISSSTDSNPVLKTLQEYMLPFLMQRASGCGSKLMAIADNRVDCSITLPKSIKAWDTCAANAFITCMGGSICDFYEKEFRYEFDMKENGQGGKDQFELLNGTVVAGNSITHKILMNRVGSALRRYLQGRL